MSGFTFASPSRLPSMTKPTSCPLCNNLNPIHYFRDQHRDYLQCQHCQLVFVPAHQHLHVQQEKAIYDLHQNGMDDIGYRQFLSRLTTPLLTQLKPAAAGLDYGCGPGPLLAAILTEAGHRMRVYDPLYAPDPEALQNSYDFITCTEVVEHFRQPGQEFQRLFGLLKADAHLGLMTKLVIDQAAFQNWHYKQDLTHVSFFSKPTLHWLAQCYHCEIAFYGSDVMIFTRRYQDASAT